VGYECPKCSWVHHLRPVQYFYPGFIVVCDCSFVFSPAIPSIHQEAPKNQRQEKQQPKLLEKTDLKDAVSILLSQGFNKSDIKKTLENNSFSGSIDEIVKQIVEKL
jgi:hypothetical protein